MTFIKCDLASLASVKKTTEQFLSSAPKLDILMCNAGIMAKPPGLTTDGYELQFGTNHIGHALVIKKLLPLLEKQSSEGGDARIVVLTSQAQMFHPKGGILFDEVKTVQENFWLFGGWRRYGQSKLANLLYARELSRRYPGIISVSIHPGVVDTNLVGDLPFLQRTFIQATQGGSLLKAEEGALNQIWAATADPGEMENGSYYEPVGILSQDKLNKAANDDALAKRLWEWTQEELKDY